MSERNANGFTLIEMLVAVAVTVIAATVAIPAFYGFLQNQRSTTEANNLVTAIQLARSEAVQRGEAVELCASDDGSTCGGSWTDGWLVRVAGGGTEVIRVWDELAAGGNVAEGGDATRIVFNSRGEADSSYGLDLWFTGCSGDRTRSIDINQAGRPSITRSNAKCD
jgi:type IV fimbrial biogenesis protein FimT